MSLFLYRFTTAVQIDVYTYFVTDKFSHHLDAFGGTAAVFG